MCQADTTNNWEKLHLPYPAAEPLYDHQDARARDFMHYGNLY